MDHMNMKREAAISLTVVLLRKSGWNGVSLQYQRKIEVDLESIMRLNPLLMSLMSLMSLMLMLLILIFQCAFTLLVSALMSGQIGGTDTRSRHLVLNLGICWLTLE